jgi:hypothetical protein
VAYRLQLPEGARVHDVFHVGVLKPFHGQPPSSTPPLPPLRHGRPLQQPKRALRASLRRGAWHVLIQWANMPASEATWEPVDTIREVFPSFQLEDELFRQGGEMLWWVGHIRGGTGPPVADHARWARGHRRQLRAAPQL